MARIPMTAREQLELGRAYGHELSVVQRGPWPEHGDPHPKFYVSCSCGWDGRAVRSRKTANGSMIWHLSRAIADGLDQGSVNGL
jgi:hypothetical protein